MSRSRRTSPAGEMNESTPTRSGLAVTRGGPEHMRALFPLLRRGFALLHYGLRAVLDMFYGATIYEMVRDLNKERSRLENMFALVVFGELLGIPILPPYYTLKLLPYVMPRIPGWRVSLLRERDLTDLCDQEIT